MRQSIANQAVRDFFLLFPPERSHRLLERSLAHLDDHPKCLVLANRLGLEPQPAPAVEVGRLNLQSPLILGAGLVKGLGFASEAEALQAVGQGQNIIPGWRAVPAIVGPVEFGSFTPKPRMGNSQPPCGATGLEKLFTTELACAILELQLRQTFWAHGHTSYQWFGGSAWRLTQRRPTGKNARTAWQARCTY